MLRGLNSREEMRRLQCAADAILERFDENEHRTVFHSGPERQRNSDRYFLESGDKVRCFFEPDAFDADGRLRVPKRLAVNKIGHALHDLDPEFRRFSFQDAVKGILRSLGYARPLLPQSMYIFKQPRIGAEVAPHQDSTFLYTEPNTVLGFWWAVEDASVDNGCLWAAPGSHKQGNRSRFVRNAANDGTLFDPPQSVLSKAGGVALEAPAGSLVLLHADLVHWSLDNRSDRSRHAYTIHVIEGRPGVVWPSSNWLQRTDGKEFTSVYDVHLD